MTSFADLTTIGVGGPIATFLEPTTRVGVIEAVEEADSQGLPLCVIGGGSNMLVSDTPFEGVVVRDARRSISVLDEAAPVEDDGRVVHVNAEAGCNWDDFVDYCVRLGLEGVEGLSGIPGTVGASVVQNIGAYGQEVATSVDSVEVWDRKERAVKALRNDQLAFGYRMSALKASMYSAPATPAAEFFPTPRYVVLSVTFALRHSDTGVVGYGQLAKALDVAVGDRMNTADIRNAVLKVRAAKGMLEDAHRYASPAMQGTKKTNLVDVALESQSKQNGDDGPDFNRHSCGSFFMNPVVSRDTFEQLRDRFPDLRYFEHGDQYKIPAGWLIDQCGWKGRTLGKAGVHDKQALVLVNRGGATGEDVRVLMQAVMRDVREQFGVELKPEPVML